GQDHSSLMSGNPQMHTFSQTTLIIRMDGRTDKNRQTITVTLCLRFVARVNYKTMHMSQHRTDVTSMQHMLETLDKEWVEFRNCVWSFIRN
ncbi:MAG: hypothetical protein MJE68_14110, partial [Proteobacteria bacterium]|nr:hypothetical protein [Pseudomonadota bacterium]